MKKISVLVLAFIALTFNLKAQIVYTDIADVTLTSGGNIGINFDGTGMDDFNIEDMGFGGTPEPGAYLAPDNHLRTVSTSEWDVLAGLSLNTVIDTATGWFDAGDVYLDPGYATTNFPQGQDSYLGAKFKNGTNIYCGWIRVNWTSGVLTIKDFAYNSTPYAPINAGDMGAVLVTSITVTGAGNVSTITTQGGTLQMNANVLPANATDNSVTWSVVNGTGSASINTSGLLTALSDGTVTVKATANDASGTVGTKVITISNQTVDIINIDNQNISVYPNPSNNYIYIKTPTLNTIEIINLSGEIVLTNKQNNTNKKIDISNLPKGLFIVKIKTENKIYQSKLLKK